MIRFDAYGTLFHEWRVRPMQGLVARRRASAACRSEAGAAAPVLQHLASTNVPTSMEQAAFNTVGYRASFCDVLVRD
ncbi:MAG: hypothetical protein ACRYG8_27620 [Janthinobacterium lividum]